MSLFYIIDSYNFILRQSSFFPSDMKSACGKFIEYVSDRRPEGSSRNRIMLVFDGQPGTHEYSNRRVEVRYTSGKSADWLIKKMTKEHDRSSDIVVVTDDKTLRRHISESGASYMSTSEFASRLFRKSDTHEDRPELSEDDIRSINEEFLRSKGLDNDHRPGT